ncbi:hypothetical protein ACQP2P_11245 [Dactylosporangium sp. CA-139114]|uniref:hypothetical protein n=1 Tax=Dactylosporangium sp. CA-139114 TaxID=3239931 RepID=UPI003D976050
MQAGDWATWASAAIAIFAAVVSVRGAASAKRSAHADEQMLHDQRKPDFKVLVEDRDGDSRGLNGTPVVMLQLLAPQTLDRIEVELRTPDVQFAAGSAEAEADGPRRLATFAETMRVGDEARREIRFPEPVFDPEDGPDPAPLPPVDTVQLVVHASAGKARWDVLLNAPVEAIRKNRRHQREWIELHRQLHR